MVSPQLQIQRNIFFETVRPTDENPPTLYHWQHCSGFRPDRSHHLHSQDGLSDTEPVIPYQYQQ